MARFTFTIECNTLAEAMAYVKALAEGGFTSKLVVCPDCKCSLRTNAENCQTCANAAIVTKAGGTCE